jgi:hypothetical protein
LASVLTARTGGWVVVFLTASALNAIAAVIALLVLKPLRAEMRRSSADLPLDFDQGRMSATGISPSSTPSITT